MIRTHALVGASVSQVVDLGGVSVKVCPCKDNTKLDPCAKCYFNDVEKACTLRELCMAHKRKDRVPVYFREIKPFNE